jgi:hypothetical protein
MNSWCVCVRAACPVHPPSLALHPNGQYVVSAQKDPKGGADKPRICVWDTVTLKQLALIEHHERGVCALGYERVYFYGHGGGSSSVVIHCQSPRSFPKSVVSIYLLKSS